MRPRIRISLDLLKREEERIKEKRGGESLERKGNYRESVARTKRSGVSSVFVNLKKNTLRIRGWAAGTRKRGRKKKKKTASRDVSERVRCSRLRKRSPSTPKA